MEAEIEKLRAENEKMRDALRAAKGAFLTPIAIMTQKKSRAGWNEYHEDARKRVFEILPGY